MLPYKCHPRLKHTIMLITSQLRLNGLSMSTIKRYLASICNLLINNSFQDVNIDSPQVELVIRGIKRLKRMLATQKVRLPITPEILGALKRVWSTNTRDNHMLWATACLGFFGFLRCVWFTTSTVLAFDPSKHLAFRDV